ncbi:MULTISPECIES: hypothetical protein [unclassified Paraburkholderia]|uniref:hypothetical protein n=1 Tax=unclassified Paraburkholderia TaxID=2615204 RepID=UPI00140465B0|nr:MULTISPECIES: hypothetical protein [unclassified Paraburkholderia]
MRDAQAAVGCVVRVDRHCTASGSRFRTGTAADRLVALHNSDARSGTPSYKSIPVLFSLSKRECSPDDHAST